VCATLFHQPRGAGHSLSGIGVAHEWQIDHHQRGVARAAHRAGVVNHVTQTHRQCAVVALDHHAKGVPYQQNVHTRLFENTGEAGVVGSEAGDFFTGLFHLSQRACGYSGRAIHGDSWAGDGAGG